MNLSPHQSKLIMPVMLVLLVSLACVSLLVGDVNLSIRQILYGLYDHTSPSAMIVWNMRIPRLLTALLIGGALSMAGVVMQSFFRNSLANPGLLGVSSGSAAGTVIAIACGWSAISLWFLPAAALVGAFAATLGVLILAKRGASTERLLLAGVALNALLGAFTSYVLSQRIGLYEKNAQILFWLLGGLEDRSWEHVFIALPIVVTAIFLLPISRSMDLMSLGWNEAQSLGVDVRSIRRRMIILSTLLTAFSTAVVGAIGFVGLIVPHGLRLIVGPEHKRLLPLSFIAGAIFVITCDIIGRLAGGIQLGIITSLIGAPFFLYLLRKLP